MTTNSRIWHDMAKEESLIREAIALEICAQEQWLDRADETLEEGQAIVLDDGCRVGKIGGRILLKYRRDYVTRLKMLLKPTE